MKSLITIVFLLPTVIFTQSIAQEKTADKTDHENPALTLEIRIQEPRIQNPDRFSEVFLDFKTGAFVLHRNRDERMASYIIGEDGKAEVALDGCKRITDSDKKEYLLDATRNTRYRSYYQYLYGLPMILHDEDKFSLMTSVETTFDKQKAIERTYHLSEPVFSAIWKITFLENGELKKLEFYNEEKPEEGEYIIFGGSFETGGVTIPRFRHWYEKKNNEYLGSDIIVSQLQKEKT